MDPLICAPLGPNDNCGTDVDGNNLDLVPGDEYTFDVFHAERHTDESTFKITTSIIFNPVGAIKIVKVTIGGETEPPADFDFEVRDGPEEYDETITGAGMKTRTLKAGEGNSITEIPPTGWMLMPGYPMCADLISGPVDPPKPIQNPAGHR